MKLKYDVPPASKFGDDPPLWKTAVSCFNTVARDCISAVDQLGSGQFAIPFNTSVDSKNRGADWSLCHVAISDAVFQGVWRQIVEGYRGALLADRCASGRLFTSNASI
jgi:hypothetical protein